MYNEGLMQSCMIDAMEDQYVETAEIPGTFLKTDYDKGDINIKMEGTIVTILKKIVPAYYMYCIYIYISAGTNSCIHNPRRLYTAP